MTAGVREVVRAPHPALAGAAAEVDPCDPLVIALAADLMATMRVSPGCVGLAAPQVGVGWRIFAVDVSAHPKTRSCQGAFVMVNPELVEASRWERSREGCMSVPNLTGDVKRATRVTVVGYAPGTAERLTVRADAFEARCLQHELDHLDGLLFLDRVAGAHAVHRRKTYLRPGERYRG